MIYDMSEGEWIDFTWSLGCYNFDTCIGYDYDGTPRLSDCISYFDADEEDDCEYFLTHLTYFRPS